MPGRTLRRARGGRGARLRRRRRAQAAPPQCRAPRPQRAGRRGRPRRVRRGRAGAGRGARRARHGRGSRQSRPRRRDAAAHRSDHPRARPRRSAARHRGRADGARAADRRGAAGGRPRRARPGVATGSRRKPAPISTRSASPSTTRPPSPRSPPSCCGTSSWSRAMLDPSAIPTAATRTRATTRTRTARATTRRRGRARRRRGRCRDPRSSRANRGEDEGERDGRRRGDERGRRRPRRGRRGGHAAGPPEPAACPTCRRSSTIKIFTSRYRRGGRGRPSLCDEEELGRLRAYLDQQLVHLQGAVTKLANRLQRRLMAQQSRSWDFDQEEGLLDAARLARVVVNPAHSLSYKVERDTEFRDTVVTPADRQFGLDARAADLDRRDLAPTSSPARSSAAGSRSRYWASPPAPGRAASRARSGWPTGGRPIRAGSTICATSSTRRRTSRGAGRARTSG